MQRSICSDRPTDDGNDEDIRKKIENLFNFYLHFCPNDASFVSTAEFILISFRNLNGINLQKKTSNGFIKSRKKNLHVRCLYPYVWFLFMRYGAITIMVGQTVSTSERKKGAICCSHCAEITTKTVIKIQFFFFFFFIGSVCFMGTFRLTCWRRWNMNKSSDTLKHSLKSVHRWLRRKKDASLYFMWRKHVDIRSVLLTSVIL